MFRVATFAIDKKNSMSQEGSLRVAAVLTMVRSIAVWVRPLIFELSDHSLVQRVNDELMELRSPARRTLT